MVVQTAKEKTLIKFIPNQLYDITKFYLENYIIKNLKKFYILRFSTVSGYSPNQNDFLIINKMHLNSIENKKITVINQSTRKSILFIDDLCRAIVYIVKSKRRNNYGIYNLSSVNAKIGMIAKKVANFHKSKIIIEKGKTHYGFYTCNKKFSTNFNFKFTSSIKKILESFHL